MPIENVSAKIHRILLAVYARNFKSITDVRCLLIGGGTSEILKLIVEKEVIS